MKLTKEQELEVIKDYQNKTSFSEMIKKYNVSDQTILDTTKKYGIKRNRKAAPKLFTKEQINFIIDNYPIKGADYCVEFLPYRRKQISKKAFDLGLKYTGIIAEEGCKICSTCKKQKSIENFWDYNSSLKDGKHSSCKECGRNQNRLSRIKREIITDKWFLIPAPKIVKIPNPELERQKEREYYNKNKQRICARKRKNDKERRKNDLNFKLYHLLKSRIRSVLKGINKSQRTVKLIDCSIEFLIQYIEKLFLPGMTWENYGPVWHIDHIIPCKSGVFDLTKPEDQAKCFHHTNLQPLWATTDIAKNFGDLENIGNKNKQNKIIPPSLKPILISFDIPVEETF